MGSCCGRLWKCIKEGLARLFCCPSGYTLFQSDELNFTVVHTTTANMPTRKDLRDPTGARFRREKKRLWVENQMRRDEYQKKLTKDWKAYKQACLEDEQAEYVEYIEFLVERPW